MIFTSFNFLVFFPILAVVFFLTPVKYRWLTLLIASYFFYINIKPIFALLVASVSLFTYIFTRLIDGTKSESRKKRLMLINIVLMLLPLFFFKYFGTINEEIIKLLSSYNLRWPLPEIQFILPIGISFYTFMAIGYTIDVYNEDIEAEKNIGIVALFISFFPLILSGPIERAKNLIPQFKSKMVLKFANVTRGAKLMLWGYFMKLVVADRLGIFIDAIYNNIPRHNGTTISIASFLYPFQVYADLGGYSLIAIGIAKVLDVNVIHNFKRPFFSTTMAELWRRWHISLITWLTDYIYTPLSFRFRKYKIWGIVIALMITFFVSGVWHGAALNYVVWGLLQGILLSLEAITKNSKSDFENKYNLKGKSYYILVSCIFTYLLFASSQVFGRAESFSEALMVFKKIFTSTGSIYFGELQQFLYAIFAVGLFLVIEIRQEFYSKSDEPMKFKKWYFEGLGYSFLILLILIIGVFDGGQFIYFQF